MALFTERELRKIASTNTEWLAKSARVILAEAQASPRTSFDVFLSHSLLDADVVLGIKTLLEARGLTVYVDWIEDPNLDRSNVTPATAHRLRTRMRQSRSLIYAHSSNSLGSKWMPWELGYFDGYRSAISILPIARMADETFEGQEFLGLYPYIDYVNEHALYVNRGKASRSTIGTTKEGFVAFNDWLKTKAGIAV